LIEWGASPRVYQSSARDDCLRQKDGASSNLQILTRFSGAIVPESWASLSMGYGKDDNLQVVCPKNDVERKSTKDRPAEISIENLKSVGRIGDEINHAIQLIEEPNCGTNASLGVPGGSVVGVLLRCRMEADGPSHQPFNLVRS
jgi:hypothetical protein